jgi:multidrug efflux pump subunit AcrB
VLFRSGITRENQEYQSMVQWDYKGSAKSGDRFHKGLYERTVVPPGFKKSLEPLRFRMTEEEESQLWWAIAISFLLIYMILVVLYENFLQPLLIMLAIPLALIGVFLGFVIMEFSFDSTAYIGVILLFGIVVSNSIILVDNINRHIGLTGEIVKAIAIGTKERIRPIFMTSATTIFGMLPMVIFKETTANNNVDIWSSLALCTVGGLTTSTVLVLLVIPIFYYYTFKFKAHLLHLKKKNLAPTQNNGNGNGESIPTTSSPEVTQ